MSRANRKVLVGIFGWLVLVCAIPAAVASPPPPGMVRLPGHVLPALAKATLIPSPPNSGAQPITITIVLKRDDQAGFERYLHEIYDPHSRNYHHYLTQEQIAHRFGPSRAHYEGVLRYLRGYGFRLEQGSKNRLTITVRGTRAGAERAFQVEIHSYSLGKSHFYANDCDPGFPRALASSVRAVQGLSDLARPAPTITALRYLLSNICINPSLEDAEVESALCYQSCPSGNVFTQGACYETCNCQIASNAQKFYQKCASDFGAADSPYANAYFQQVNSYFCKSDPPSAQHFAKISPAAATIVDGTGQKVGLVEFDSFNSSDIADYLALLGLSSSLINNVSKVDVNGGTTPGANQDEVLVDIEALLTIAPGAQVVVYDAPFAGAGNSFQPVLNKMINDGVNIISNSWAYCEDQTTQADVDSIDTLFQQAAAAGITVFNGTGDSGSTCLDGSANTVAVPADSPNATAVGGSSLTLGIGDVYGSESWWNGSTATPPSGQGGFGLSKFFNRPAYQGGLNTTSNRSVPDVVINADPQKGVIVCEASAGGCPNGLIYNGTSNAAPAWAAVTAELNEALGKNLGALNPSYYRKLWIVTG